MSFIQEMRKYRIFGIAIFDLVGGWLGLMILFLIAWRVHFPKLEMWRFVVASLLLTIPLGIVFHVLFGTNTELSYRLGLSYKP